MATTVTGLQILVRMAEDLNELYGRKITTATSTTQVTCASDTSTTDTYKYGFARILGKGISVVQTSSNVGVFTFSPAFSVAPALGDILQLCWWQEQEQARAIAAANEAIRTAFPLWWRDTTVNAATSSITLAANTDSYSLPTAAESMIAVGIQPTNLPIQWIPAEEQDQRGNKRVNYVIEGQPGALVVRFMPGFSRDGSINSIWATQKLCTRYAAREPELGDLTSSSCQLPIDYFSVGALAYSFRKLYQTSHTEMGTDNVAVAQLQQVAAAKLAALHILKKFPYLLGTEPLPEPVKQQGKKAA